MNKLPRLKTLLLFQFLITALIPVAVYLYLRDSRAAHWIIGLELLGYLAQRWLTDRAEKQLDECARKALNQADAICLEVAHVLVVAAILGLVLEWDRIMLVMVLSCGIAAEHLLRAILFAVFDKVGIE